MMTGGKAAGPPPSPCRAPGPATPQGGSAFAGLAAAYADRLSHSLAGEGHPNPEMITSLFFWSWEPNRNQRVTPSGEAFPAANRTLVDLLPSARVIWKAGDISARMFASALAAAFESGFAP